MNRYPTTRDNEGGETLRWLLGLPIDNAERDKLRDRVPYSAKRLEQMTRKYLSLSPEFHTKRKPYWWMETAKEPIYPAWARSRAQLPCKPFESGRNTLPGLEKWKQWV